MRLSPITRIAVIALAGALLAGCASTASTAKSDAAQEVPVIFLVMDEFPGASIQAADGGIDPERMPNLAAISRQATYYPNTTTNAALTLYSFPSFLSGRRWRGSLPSSRNTMYGMLRRSHRLYQGEPVKEIRQLCGFCKHPLAESRSFFGVPAVGGSYQTTSMKATYAQMLALKRVASSGRKPVMWSAHVMSPHGLYQYLPSGARYPVTAQSEFPSVTGSDKRLSTNRRLVEADQKRFLVQASLTDRFIGLMKSQLTRAGIWDRALVIMTSDHGSSAVPGTKRRGLEKRNLTHIGSIPLVIKYPGQQEGKIDTGSAQLIDLVPTIAQATGRKPGWSVDGVSLMKENRPKREVRVYIGESKGWLRKGFDAFVADRAKVVKAWNTTFTGAPQDTWMGAGPSLRGKPVRDLNVTGSKVRATIAGAGKLRKVSKGSGWVPALISGTLKGVAPGRTVAVAIDGKVAAAGYSYRNKGAVRFNILVNEDDLRNGRNRIELFEVENGQLARISTG